MLTSPEATDHQPELGVRPALTIVPVRLRDSDELDAIVRRLVSLSCSAPGVPIVVASGADSAPALLDLLAVAAEALGGELVRSPDNVLAAVNAGLRAAAEEGLDAVLATGVFGALEPHWLDRLRARRDSQGRPAAIVGARLMHATGLTAGAGRYFSLFTREWHPRLQYAPADLAAVGMPCLCPVDGLTLLRAETLDAVGLLDERLSIEDAELDLCLRVFATGGECVYEPSAVGILEPVEKTPRPPGPERSRDLLRSEELLRDKHRNVDFSLFTPEVW